MALDTIFDYLVDLERRARRKAAPLPRQEQIKDTWTGMGFRLQENDVVVFLEQIHEILTIPQMTVVPGTRSWVKGIANVRGSLLPIMDLRGFLGMAGVAGSPMNRVLVINHEGIFAGLVVDQIWGLKHFFLDQKVAGDEASDSMLATEMRPYVSSGFQDDEKLWPVFSLHALAEDTRFLHVAE